MLDIVTVTCSRDLPQMALQAHSIDIFVKKSITHYIFIEDYKFDEEHWLNTLSLHYNRHSLKIYHGLLEKDLMTGDGWSRQQLLKLFAAKYVDKNYLILDSKNLFIKDTNLNYEITEGTWIRNTHDNVYSDLKPFYYFLIGYLKKSPPTNLYTAHTPFIMKKDTVLKILEEHDIKNLFLLSIENNMRPSEFLLYSFYCDKEPLEIDQTTWWGKYNDISTIYKTWWRDKDLDPTKLESIYNSNVEILGIHKNLWYYKNNKIRKLADWLCTKGLSEIYVHPATVSMTWGNWLIQDRD